MGEATGTEVLEALLPDAESFWATTSPSSFAESTSVVDPRRVLVDDPPEATAASERRRRLTSTLCSDDLEEAVVYCKANVVDRLLRQEGASSGSSLGNCEIRASGDPKYNPSKRRPLHVAAEWYCLQDSKQCKRVMQSLIDAGGDVSAQDSFDNTVLHVLVKECAGKGA